MNITLNFPLPWLGEGLLYAAAINSFKDLIYPQKKCLTGWLLLTSLGLLIYAHSICDFNFLNVVEHNHTQQPLLYRVAAVWGNHEGSMLLWVTLLSLYQILACRSLPIELRQPVRTILSCLLLIFIVFMLVACNPFLSTLSPPLQGEGLNPTLQDPSLTIHPPCLYAGYTGMVIPFALSLTALVRKQLSLTCINSLKQWTLIAWTWLTLGLGLGSFWAYYELGWGGWWFWDPVETISLLPWLTATALLHTLRVPNSERITLKLALSGFIFCLMILFFVRSGLLTSVHSFAVDAERGLLLFGILFMTTFAAMCVWFKNRKAWSSPSSSRGALGDAVIQGNTWVATLSTIARHDEKSWSFSFRSLISLQSICISLAIFSLIVAIVYPLLAEQWGQTISISPFYFQATFIPLSIPILLSMGLAPWVSRKPFTRFSTLSPALTVTLAVWLGLFWWNQTITLFGLIILSIGVWIVISHLYSIAIKGFENPPMYLAHLGLGIAIVGMVISTYNSQQVLLNLILEDIPNGFRDMDSKIRSEHWSVANYVKRGASAIFESHILKDEGYKLLSFAEWKISLQQINTQPGPNYTARQAILNIYDSKQDLITVLKPERRYFTAAKVIHTEVAFYSTWLSHLYVVLLNDDKEPYTIQIEYKPLINLLGLGILMMVMGGGLAVVRRKY